MKDMEHTDAATNEAEAAVFDIKTDIDKLTLKQARAECEYWRRLWSWLPASVQYLITKVGQEVVFYTRDGRTVTGWYAGPEVDIRGHNIQSAMMRYDHIKSQQFVEQGNFTLTESNITGRQFVSERYEYQDPSKIAQEQQT